MRIPSLWLIIITSQVYILGRELAASRKAIIQPLSEHKASFQRGNDGIDSRHRSPAAGVSSYAARRIDSRNVRRSSAAHGEHGQEYESGTITAGNAGLDRGGIQRKNNFAPLVAKVKSEMKDKVTSLSKSGSNASDYFNSSLSQRISQGVADGIMVNIKEMGQKLLPNFSNTLKKQIGGLKPYCSIVPCRNVFSVLSNLMTSIRLYMVDKHLKHDADSLMMFIMSFASFIPLYVTEFARSPFIMDFLRRRWAFQGECGEMSVEYVLNAMLKVLVFESALKAVLRVWFYSNKLDYGAMVPGFVSGIGRGLWYCFSFIPYTFNAIAAGVFGGYWSVEAFSALTHMFVHSVVFARLVLFTAVQYAFYQENYDTAAFFINPIVSQIASAFSGFIFALASTSNIGTMLMLKNFSNLADVEHLLDYAGFRITESYAAATGYARNAFHNIPNLFKPTSLDILVKLSYYHEYISRLLPSGIEWPVLLLHITMALNSNSAAGLYLSAVNFVYAVINQRLSSYERSLITKDIQEIVQESN